MKTKRILSAIMALAMIVSMMGANVYAVGEDETVINTSDEYVAKVGETEYTDLQEAIVAAAPAGTVDIVADVVVDEWKMFWQGDKTFKDIIFIDMNGLTINGNGHTLTVNSIVSSGNGNQLFKEATELNIHDLKINVVNGAGGIGLESGSIQNVTITGGTCGVHPGTGGILIEGCTFATNGTAIYYEEARDYLTVKNNTFNQPANGNVILLRGNTVFSGNTVNSGRTVNVVSGSPVVTGNDFGDVRFKVYNVATATIKDNEINVLEFSDNSTKVESTFGENIYSEEAEQALKDAGVIKEAAPVAKIGNNGYTALADAIAAAQKDDIIVLVGDVTEDVTINKSITLDGANKQYTGKMTLNKVDVTIQNVNFVKGNIYKNKRTGTGGNFTIKDCDFDGQGLNDYAVNLGGTSSINIERCTAKGYGYGFLQVPASNNSVAVKKVQISDVNYGFKIDYSNGVTLEDVTVTDARVAGVLDSNYGKKVYTIKNCNITGASPIGIWERNTTTFDTFNFVGTNNLGATEFTISDYAKLKLADADSVLTACAGLSVTSDDPKHNVVYEEGAYKVARVARIGEKEYITLQDAIDDAADGDIIKVVRDTDAENATISKNVTIDLNGKTVTGNVVVDEGATVEIKNGTIICTNVAYDTINSFGNVTLTDVEADGERHIVRAKKGTVTINGGTYKWTGSATGTRNVINIGDDGDPENNIATATINGGTFIGPKGTSAESGAAVVVQKGSTVTIKDGMFTNGKNNTLAAQDDATLSVEGGTYDQDPTAYVAEGSRAVKNVVTGIWSVIPAGHTIDIEAVPAECYGEEGVAVSVTVNGVDFANAEWTLTYDPSVVEYVDHTDGTNGVDISVPVDAVGMITDKLYTHTDGDPFKGSTVVVTYNFKTISQDTDDVEGIFTLANAVVDTAKSSNYGDTEVEGDTTKVIVKRRDFENITISEAVNGTTEDITDKITDSKYEIKYDGFVHEFAVDTSADGEIINYTITKDGADVTEIRAKGTYVITYTIEKIGYKPYTDTLTVVIGDPAFVLETSTYTLENYTLVMVYMNAEGMYPTFDGKAMYDITASGYEYQADPTAEGVPYGYVYGIVIPEPGATDDLKAKVAFNTSAPLAVNLYDEDVNFNGEVTDRDAVVAVNTYKGNKDQLEDYDLLSRVLKADVTKNKKVDMDDVTAVELKAAK